MQIKKVMPAFAIAIGLALAVATSGFKPATTTISDNGQMITAWFEFVGNDPTNLSQVEDYLNYSYTDGQPCSGLTTKICAVQTVGVPQMGQHPSSPFSTSLKSEIDDVVNGAATYPYIAQRQQ